MEDRPRARRTDPQQSHEAAASAERNRTKNQNGVIVVLRLLGQATDEALVSTYQDLRRTDMWKRRIPAQSESGIRTRRKELVDRGHVKQCGEKTKEVNGRKLRYAVWRALEGREIAAKEGTMRKVVEEIEEQARQERTEGTLFDPGRGKHG